MPSYSAIFVSFYLSRPLPFEVVASSCASPALISLLLFFFLLPGTDGRVRVCTSNWLVVWNAAREASLRRSDPSSLLFFLFCFTSSFFFFPPCMCDRCSLSCVIFLFIVALELLLIVFFFFPLSLHTFLFLSLIRKAAPFQTIVLPSFMSVIAVCHLKAQLNSCTRLLCVSGLSTTTHIYVCMSVYVWVRVFAFGCTWCFFFFQQQRQQQQQKSAVCVCTYAPAMFGS